MAGLGYKDFTAGAVLTAAQVDGYLMEQAVMNFAGTAARGSALSGVVAAGMVAHVGAGTLTVYDGSNWQQVYPTSGGGAFKNLLYNSAMQVSQRGTSTASITAVGYYTADRWYTNSTGTFLGAWTQSVENDAPTGSGFRKSLKMLCTTAAASPAAAATVRVDQFIEGQDLQRIAKGTTSAQQLTLSFWVKSNATGTYVVELIDADNSRTVSASYTVSASATWERKTITFPADTTGAFDNDNAASLRVCWTLGSGTDFTSGTLATTWATPVNANRYVGQTNLAAATNNYWQVTGVQLEIGSQATAFEFKSYGQELAECQRYYYLHASGNLAQICMGAAYSASIVFGIVHFPVTMRAIPNAVATTGTNYYSFARNSGIDSFNSVTIFSASTTTTQLQNTTEIASTAGHAGVIEGGNASMSVAFSAEL
jgi:hypothetical protein